MMKYNLTKTAKYILVVDDSEIREVDWAIHNYKNYREQFKEEPIKANKNNVQSIQEHWDKIIAHLPLNNSPILEGVPSLPPLEDDVEKMAYDYSNEFMNVYDGYKGSMCFFMTVYNKAHEKYKFTEEFLLLLIDEIGNSKDYQPFITDEEGVVWTINKEHLLQFIQQPKYPIAFECEMEYKDMAGYWYSLDEVHKESVERFGLQKRTKTIINSEGRTQWVGKYIYQ